MTILNRLTLRYINLRQCSSRIQAGMAEKGDMIDKSGEKALGIYDSVSKSVQTHLSVHILRSVRHFFGRA